VRPLGVLAGLFFVKADDLQDRISARAEWAAQKALPEQSAPGPSWLNRIARKGRVVTAWLYWLWRQLIVHVLGVVIGVVALILFSPYWIFRVFRRREWMAR